MIEIKTRLTAVEVGQPDAEEVMMVFRDTSMQDFEIMMPPNFTWPAVDFRQAHEERKGKR